MLNKVSPIFAGESNEVDDFVQDDVRSVHPGLVAYRALLLLPAAILAAQMTSFALNHRSGHVALTRGTR